MCGGRSPIRATAATGPPPKLSDDVRVEAARRYIQVCELITGRPFVPDTTEPNARIRKNLKIG